MKIAHFTLLLLMALLAACSTEAPVAASLQPSPQILPTTPAPMVDTPAVQPTATASAPSGEAIYYGLRERKGEGYADLGVFRYDLNTASLSQVAPEGWNLQDVSPDGSRLLLNLGNQLFTTAFDGSATHLLSDQLFNFGSRTALWKKDGSGVVYITTGESGTAIVSDSAEGGQSQKLTSDMDSPIRLEGISSTGDVYWQKGTCKGEEICAVSGVFQTAAAGVPATEIANAKSLALSPDGAQFAYAYSNEDGKSSLGLQNIATASGQGIGLPGDLLGEYAWSPEGSRIAAVRYDRSDYSGRVSGTRNFLVDVATLGVKELPESEGLQGRMLFSPDGQKLLLASSVQSGNGYGIKFNLVDLASGKANTLAGLQPEENGNFLILTNLSWAGQ